MTGGIVISLARMKKILEVDLPNARVVVEPGVINLEVTGRVAAADFFFVNELPPYDPAELIPQKGDAALALKVLKRARDLLAHTEFTHDALDSTLRAAAQELGIKPGQMFQPIRVAVCGRKNAPPLFETLEVLGRETTLARIEKAILKLQ